MMYTETSEVPETTRPFLYPFMLNQNQPKKESGEKKCVLMFTQPMEKGTCILGMPFMRNYYTTFNRKMGTVSTALHDGNCNMGMTDAAAAADAAAAPLEAKEAKNPFEAWTSAWNKVSSVSFRQKLDTTRQTLKRIDLNKVMFSDGFMSLWQKHQNAEAKKLEAAVDKAAEKAGLPAAKGGMLLKGDKAKDGLLLREEKPKV